MACLQSTLTEFVSPVQQLVRATRHGPGRSLVQAFCLRQVPFPVNHLCYMWVPCAMLFGGCGLTTLTGKDTRKVLLSNFWLFWGVWCAGGRLPWKRQTMNRPKFLAKVAPVLSFHSSLCKSTTATTGRASHVRWWALGVTCSTQVPAERQLVRDLLLGILFGTRVVFW